MALKNIHFICFSVNDTSFSNVNTNDVCATESFDFFSAIYLLRDQTYLIFCGIRLFF